MSLDIAAELTFLSLKRSSSF